MNDYSFKILKEIHSKEIFILQNKNIEDFGQNIWRAEELTKSIKQKVLEGYIFIHDQKINGFCFFKKIDDFIEIYSIFVDPLFRQKGIAKKFIDKCKEYCNENNLKKIILDVNETNDNAIEFYKKNNFLFCGKRKNYYRNNTNFNDSFTMYKLL
jgi:Acetyltransferases